MLSDSDRGIRRDAVETIRSSWKHYQKYPQGEVRKFQVPQLNFKAKSWVNMIDWELTDLYEPPLTRSLSNDDLKVFQGLQYRGQGSVFPCHSQMVERMVQEVTKASCTVVGSDTRDFVVKSTLSHRTKHRKQESKKDFIS